MTSCPRMQQPQTTYTGSLLCLPNETLLQIGGHLDVVSAASFSLASTHLYKLSLGYPSSEWSTTASETRHETHDWECKPINEDLGIIPQACNNFNRWKFLQLLEKDLKTTHTVCIYCRVLHRLLPQPSLYKTACPWMALGPNYWNIGKLTFDDCYHALNDPDRPISSLRTSKALGTQQFQVFLAWPIRSTSSKTITLPATKTAYHLPSLSFDSDWQPHPLSNSSPDSPYRHVFVKASLSCALVELPSSPNSIYSSFKHPNLLTYSTQRVYLPPEAFIPNPKPTSPDTTPDDSSSNQPPTRHYLGFQTCRHQPSYHPETTNPLLNQARYNGGQPRDILEESLNIFYNNEMRCWRPPLKSRSSSPPPPGTNPNPNTHLQPETSVYRPQVCHLCQTRYRAAVYTWPTDPSLPAAKEIVVHVWQNLGSFQEKHGHMKGNFPQSWFAPVGGKMEKGEYTRDARPAFLMGWDARLGAGYWGEYEVCDHDWAVLYFGDRWNDGVWREFWWCGGGIARGDTKDGGWKVVEGDWSRWADLPGRGEEGEKGESGRDWLGWWG
ncbi:hypothetical protein QC764_0082640 [Podospora pseudoanserina]|uniref:F-box domain-containing protein n=1 Tax=Podospora pseudoanserina TaxID=2609844 RepID=A0ABR0I6V1_9PEZI|nr:hypothetical protein QC764_0082640 [Podospora pseudoanserina]